MNTAKPQWARLQADVNIRIRRGAWYKVKEIGELNAVIEVNKRPVSVLKALLEIVDRPPPKWTMVHAPGNSRAAPADRYGVCPACSERAVVRKRARRFRCPHCKWEFEVAWDEGYLGAP
ncbi:MAG TPA: hypothetical protein VFK78_00330 [Gemmatimonadales bacterium]|nr:hypothetical protein [Gemmatimonadales bacterium]